MEQFLLSTPNMLVQDFLSLFYWNKNHNLTFQVDLLSYELVFDMFQTMKFCDWRK